MPILLKFKVLVTSSPLRESYIIRVNLENLIIISSSICLDIFKPLFENTSSLIAVLFWPGARAVQHNLSLLLKATEQLHCSKSGH